MIKRRGKENENRPLELEQAAPSLPDDLNNAESIAGVIVRRGIEGVSVKLRCDKDQVVKRLKGGHAAARRELKLALAHYLAEYLGFYDQDVKAVYVADHIDNYREEVDETPRGLIQLVVFAEPKTAALTALVSALSRAVTGELRDWVGWVEKKPLLEVQLVDSSDLEHLARYAALLVPPSYYSTRIWQREPLAE